MDLSEALKILNEGLQTEVKKKFAELQKNEYFKLNRIEYKNGIYGTFLVFYCDGFIMNIDSRKINVDESQFQNLVDVGLQFKKINDFELEFDFIENKSDDLEMHNSLKKLNCPLIQMKNVPKNESFKIENVDLKKYLVIKTEYFKFLLHPSALKGISLDTFQTLVSNGLKIKIDENMKCTFENINH